MGNNWLCDSIIDNYISLMIRFSNRCDGSVLMSECQLTKRLQERGCSLHPTEHPVFPSFEIMLSGGWNEIIFPFHSRNHWCLLVASREKASLTVYDSMRLIKQDDEGIMGILAALERFDNMISWMVEIEEVRDPRGVND